MNKNGWRVRVANEVQSKERALRSILLAINDLDIDVWSKWEISTKSPTKKENVSFVHWQEHLRLSEVFEEYGFSSTKQGQATLYSAALYDRKSPRRRSPSPIFDIDDLDSLPSLQDVIRGSKKAPISIPEEENEEVEKQENEIKREPKESKAPEASSEALQAGIEGVATEGPSMVTTGGPSVVVTGSPPAAEDPLAAEAMEEHWSRQSGDGDRGLRLRPKGSLRATARLRERSQRRGEDRRSRSRGVTRKKT
jgi:hypothetical protein